MSEEWRYHNHGSRAAVVTEAGYTIVDGLMISEAKVIVMMHNAAVRRLMPQLAPVEPEPEPATTYFVQATYATPNGNRGRWSGRMGSSSGDILADAERIVRKYRRVAGKLDIKATAIRS